MDFTLDNHFLELKADVDQTNRPRQVLDSFYSYVEPRVFTDSKLLLHSESCAQLLGVSVDQLYSKDFEKFLKAQTRLGISPYACLYGGHQFGHWAGQLGDGRAITYGQIKGADQTYTIQFKGLGPTPYSRAGDGYAVLRSSIREYLMSEAMAHLGVPTTRALSLALSGEFPMRDRYYNGNTKAEPGAIVCRVAPNFIRFGSFEIFAAREDLTNLKILADYTIEHYFPQIKIRVNSDYIRFFEEVVKSSLVKLVHWQSIGFVHGVLNTDNMAISGETIDYGPYGFLDEYDPSWTPNTTDAQNRRYRYENQPNIVLWNLLKLANALYPLCEDAKAFETILNRFKLQYEQKMLHKNKLKLGLYKESAEDESMVESLFELIRVSKADYTLFFRKLSELDQSQMTFDSIREVCYTDSFSEDLEAQWSLWLKAYQDRLSNQGVDELSRQMLMKQHNPRFILRNYMLEEAIQKAEAGDYSLLTEFSDLIKTPYEDNPKADRWIVIKPESAGDSSLSCSS